MWTSLYRAFGALTDSERDFSLAAQRIQAALLTVQIPAIAGLDIGVRASPARQVGGDYIDLFPVDDQRLVFGLGDASGKSLSAALNALMLRYLVRGLVKALSSDQLEAITAHANDVVTEDLHDSDHFITFLIGSLEISSGLMRIVNAGHEPPLILRVGASSVETLPARNLVLGVNAGLVYTSAATTLEVGDLAVTYTDGLTEASNSKGELFTIERLAETIVAHRHLRCAELADCLFETVKNYAGQDLRDDATVLALRRTNEAGLRRGG
ncbi:MAG: PP2C family protein-serine/threonine phosphatase [Candidatus Cybelea sp.]